MSRLVNVFLLSVVEYGVVFIFPIILFVYC